MKRPAFSFFALLVVGLCCSVLSAAELRTWTDSTGKFKIEAELVSHRDGQVELKTSKGKTIRMPENKLSKADQEYLGETAENPFEAGVVSEPAEEPASSAAEKSNIDSAGTPNTGGADKVTIPDYSGDVYRARADAASSLPPMMNQIPWKVKPDTQTIPTPDAPRPFPFFALDRLKDSFFINNPQFLFAEDGVDRAVLLFNSGMKNEDAYLAFSSLDEKPATLLPLPFCPLKSDLSPDGSILAGVREIASGPFDKYRFFSLIRLTETQVKPVYQFIMKEPDKSRPGDSFPIIRWASNDQFFAAEGDDSGDVILWELNGLNPIYSFQGNAKTLSLSPNRKMFAVAAGNDKIEIRDTMSGAPLGLISAENEGLAASATAFSPDGARLAVVFGDKAVIYRMSDGLEDFRFEKVSFTESSRLLWTDAESLLVGQRLYRRGCDIPLCDYSGIWRTFPFCFHQGKVWAVLEEAGTIGVIGYQLPHPEAVAAYGAIDRTEYFFGPGKPVRLLVSLGGFGDEAAAKKFLTERLAAKEIAVSDSAPVTLEYSLKKSETQMEGKIRRQFSVHRDEGTVRLTGYEESVVIRNETGTIWSSVALRTSDGSELPDTENVEEYKAALLAANKPNPEFYKKVKLPKKVTAYDNKAAANGIITLTGIKGVSGGNEQ